MAAPTRAGDASALPYSYRKSPRNDIYRAKLGCLVLFASAMAIFRFFALWAALYVLDWGEESPEEQIMDD